MCIAEDEHAVKASALNNCWLLKPTGWWESLVTKTGADIIYQ